MVSQLCLRKEYPFNLFLVLSGTFAYVATPSQRGGVAYSEDLLVGHEALFSFVACASHRLSFDAM